MRLAVTAFAVVAFGLAAIPAAHAQGDAVEKGVFGAGIIVGEPTGISVKLYLDNDMAIDGAVGSAFIGGGFQVHADVLWHPWVLEDQDTFVLPAYWGVGLRALNHGRGDGADRDFHVGVRAVIGIVFDFKEIPIDVFAEVAGVGDFILGAEDEGHGGFGLDINAGLGARYYF